MIHIDKGGDKEFTKYFFDKLNANFFIKGESNLLKRAFHKDT